MPRFVAHDSRLRGSVSPADIRGQSLLYHQYTPACHLSNIVQDFERDWNNYYRQHRISFSERSFDMEIWAHGLELGAQLTGVRSYDRYLIERRFPGVSEEEGIRRLNEATLGYGIQLCWEILSFSTIHHLEPLRGKISSLTLNVCGAAHISQERILTQRDLGTYNRVNELNGDPTMGSLNFNGNGHELCSALARRLQCIVYASTESQIYIADGLSFGNREGLWVTYGSDGRLNRTARRYPSGYVDCHGNIRGNEGDPIGREVHLD